MLSRERVIRVIEKQKFDRLPIYGWLRANLNDEIAKEFGSVEAFEDHYSFDFAHLFGGPSPHNIDKIDEFKECNNNEITPCDLLDIPLNDVDDMKLYDSVIKDINHHKEKRGRFVYVQTPGIFECLNSAFGIENHLMYMLLYKEDLIEVYKRQAEWNKRFASNMIDLGIDMIHVSDDWGAQNNLLFSPKIWNELIFSYHKSTCDFVKSRNTYLSLHSDGNISSILNKIPDLGYDVLHPYQESAGMSYDNYFKNYKNSFTIMGGLDVQTTIGFNNLAFLKDEIKRIIRTFSNRGILLCTSHFVQNHCTIEELKLAYDTIYETIRA